VLWVGNELSTSLADAEPESYHDGRKPGICLASDAERVSRNPEVPRRHAENENYQPLRERDVRQQQSRRQFDLSHRRPTDVRFRYLLLDFVPGVGSLDIVSGRLPLAFVIGRLPSELVPGMCLPGFVPGRFPFELRVRPVVARFVGIGRPVLRRDCRTSVRCSSIFVS